MGAKVFGTNGVVKGNLNEPGNRNGERRCQEERLIFRRAWEPT